LWLFISAVWKFNKKKKPDHKQVEAARAIFSKRAAGLKPDVICTGCILMVSFRVIFVLNPEQKNAV